MPGSAFIERGPFSDATKKSGEHFIVYREDFFSLSLSIASSNQPFHGGERAEEGKVDGALELGRKRFVQSRGGRWSKDELYVVHTNAWGTRVTGCAKLRSCTRLESTCYNECSLYRIAILAILYNKL